MADLHISTDSAEALRFLNKIVDLVDDENVAEPLDDAIEYAKKAIAALGPQLIECSVCHGSGFSGRGTGYDDVCSECGGQRYFPAAAQPPAGAFDDWFDSHFLDPDGGSSHLPDWLKDDLRLAWDAALSASPPLKEADPVTVGETLNKIADELIGIQEDLTSHGDRNRVGEAVHWLRKAASSLSSTEKNHGGL